MHRIFAFPGLLLALGAPLSAQVTIGTTATTVVGPLGAGVAPGDIPTTVAQTFALPAGTVFLQSFSFFYIGEIGGSDLQVDASVVRFASNAIVPGSAIYTSPFFDVSQETANNIPITFGTAENPLNLNLGGVTLSAGETFALVLSSIGGSTSAANGAQIGIATTSTGDPDYAGGSLFLSLDSEASGLMSAGDFLAGDDFGSPDAAFSATFTAGPVTATPEPSSVALLGTGVAGLFGVVRRRSRKRNG